MLRLTEIKLPLDHADDALRDAVLARLGVPAEELLDITVFRRGHDARRRGAITLIYTLDVALRDETAVLARLAGNRHVAPTPETGYRLPSAPPAPPRLRPVVVGAGPCGLFAMLILAQMGLRPILLERGKVVRQRTQDTWGLWRRSVLTPESNVQFGEGGAGTFSDGKLWSGIGDNANRIRKVLEEFVKAGAPEEILYVSKPHIGTFRLVSMVEHMRAQIESLGGEYRFGTRVENLELGPDRRLRGLHLSDGCFLEADHVLLAVGHSARDTFTMLHERGVYMEAKPFSIGVRIEHPQGLIDRCRFGPQAGHPILGAADYKLVHHCKAPEAEGRAVYSFCMCPGGTVVAAASEPGRLVTNGMSQYSRNERNANAGIVVSITPERDYPGSPLAGIEFQRHWEERAFVAGGGDYRAPAQRVEDFLAGRPSTKLGEVIPSYRPGVTPTDLAQCLPDFAVAAIREALPAFDRQIKGFAMGDAVMTGVETRTSSPLRIRRDETGQSLNTPGLFPAGEGAGYAGGILSAGVDGIRAAEAVAASLAAVVPAD
jgi:uncharacterized FAD-dependent dehydrogenase